MANLKTNCAIGIDVGGSTVDAGIVIYDIDQGLKMLGSVSRIESPSAKPFEQMIKEFEGLIANTKHQAQESGLQIKTVGLAMPGPFDYENGISKMQQKFEDAYEKDFKQPLEQFAQVPIFFVNDADAFGLGVYAKLYPGEKRIFGITFGTGTGSAFVVDGKLAIEIDSEKDNIPQDGEIWNIPYKQGNFEDYVSKETIITDYEQATGKKLEVHEIATLARNQDEDAITAFEHYGANLANGLKDVIVKFQPTKIVLGGQITKSLDLFEKPIKEMFTEIQISTAVDENYAIYGAAYYASTKIEESKASDTPRAT